MSCPRTPGKSAHKASHKTPRRQNGPREAVQVYGRLRPLRAAEDGPCVRVVGKTDMILTPPEKSVQFATGRKAQVQHTFHQAYSAGVAQKEVFNGIGLPLVTDLLNSKNGLLFAYGITGSGKTHTMTGDHQDPGVLPRCLDVIFNSIQHLQAKKYTFVPNGKNHFEVNTEAQAERERRRHLPGRNTRRRNEETSIADTIRLPESFIISDLDPDCVYGVVVSYIEIFNDYVFDLLEDTKDTKDMRDKGPQSKKMREDTGRHQMYINDVTEIPVTSTEEAYEQLVKGQKKRRVAHTHLNEESSRSHSIFNIRLIRAPLDEAGRNVLLNPEYLVVSQLSLVDLAGSERAVRTQSAGERLREAGSINQSLMVLRTCLEYLRDNQNKPLDQQKIVPYRDSKLTQLFKNFFEGDGKVRMIICCSSANSDFDEMLYVMKFAEVTQAVTVARSQAVKFDIPGLAPGRRQISEAIDAISSGTTGKGQSLPFNFDYVMAPDSPHSTYSPYIERFERQTREFESGLRYFQLGMDAFKTSLHRALATCASNTALSQVNHDLQRANQQLVFDVDERDQKLGVLQQILQNNMVSKDGEEELRRTNKHLRSELEDRERVLATLVENSRYAQQDEEESPEQSPVKSTPATPLSGNEENTPGHNQAPLRGRKRRSVDKWLEHKPEGTLQTDAVMQPKLKKSKVVANPKKSDLAHKNYGKYMLHHQEEDSIGEVKEHLFKGSVLKTRTGGMSVQFTDVETLQQRKPEQLSRRSTGVSPGKMAEEEVEEAEEQPMTLAQRCATGLEHRVISGR